MHTLIRLYTHWIPFIARLIFAFLFLQGAYYKFPGTASFTMEVGMTGHAGVPFPMIAVILAFILEVGGGIALLIGWRTRLAAFLLAGFVLILNFVFFRNISDQTTFGFFMSNFGLIAGLLYISVCGARSIGVDRN